MFRGSRALRVPVQDAQVFLAERGPPRAALELHEIHFHPDLPLEIPRATWSMAQVGCHAT